MKGGQKNCYEHETTTTHDTPQEGRNNRRTLLITGGKLGCRPQPIHALTKSVTHPHACEIHEYPLYDFFSAELLARLRFLFSASIAVLLRDRLFFLEKLFPHLFVVAQAVA